MCRFRVFRRTLDAEMKDATKSGIGQCHRKGKSEITEEDERKLWEMKLLGSQSAESLLHTIYYFNGKLFGLRSGEHRLLRVHNIKVKENMIIFDESHCKTFQGGLNDVKNKPRYIEHVCHDIGEVHYPCLVNMYEVYISKVRKLVEKIESFYFRPHRSGTFEYEESAVGLCTLNKILPVKLCEKAGLERKTAHCLRVTCASRLFQEGVEEKLVRERTGHKSNALFGYEKASKKQLRNVSDALGPVNDTRRTDVEAIESVVGLEKRKSEANFSTSTVAVDDEKAKSVDNWFDDLEHFQFDVPDSVLAEMPLPEFERTRSNRNGDSICTHSVFNSCTINFVVNDKK